MGEALSNAQATAYREQGILFPLPALSPAEVEECRAALARIEALPEPARSRALKSKSHLVSRTLAQVIRKPAILDAVEQLVGPDLLVWGSSFFNKAGGTPDYVSWHQDATYWGLEPPDIVTAWVALTPSTAANGCMRVVPGSQKWPIMPHRETFAEGNLLSRGQEIAVEVKDGDAVDVVLAPGQMSLHHVLIAHGSEPNRSTEPRIGFAIRYIGGHVRQTKAAHDTATLVRGRNVAGTFELEREPRGELDPADLDYQANIHAGAPHLPKAAATAM
jgi:ectoine hydroxylase-related dioxygenase (phytanoyl-CoA dioxygenase family)